MINRSILLARCPRSKYRSGLISPQNRPSRKKNPQDILHIATSFPSSSRTFFSDSRVFFLHTPFGLRKLVPERRGSVPIDLVSGSANFHGIQPITRVFLVPLQAQRAQPEREHARPSTCLATPRTFWPCRTGMPISRMT